jgi:hypothetical protein
MSARSKTGFNVQPSPTREGGESESAYISNPQNSLHEIIINASQVKQGEIDLSSDFEGDRERLACFPKSGISGWEPYIKSRRDIGRQDGEKDQRPTSALGNPGSSGG